MEKESRRREMRRRKEKDRGREEEGERIIEVEEGKEGVALGDAMRVQEILLIPAGEEGERWVGGV